MIRIRNRLRRPNYYPPVGCRVVINQHGNPTPILGTVTDVGPFGVRLDGSAPIMWDNVWAFDRYHSIEEFDDFYDEAVITLMGPEP